MSFRLKHWVGLGAGPNSVVRKLLGGAAPSPTVAPSQPGDKPPEPTKAPAPPPSADPDLLSMRPDPSKMYLPSPHDRKGPEAKRESFASAQDVSVPPSLLLQSKWASMEDSLDKEDIEHAKRLCRQLEPEHWEALFSVFTDAVIAARGGETISPTEAADASWSTEPWYYLDPARFGTDEDNKDTPDLESMLEYVDLLGFRNIALLGHLTELDLGRWSPLIDRLGLRVTTELDLTAEPFARHGAAELARLLAVLTEEVRLGVLGVRTHAVDQIDPDPALTAEGSPEAHAFHALVKLFLRLLRPEEVVIPELSRASAQAPLYSGGGVEIHGIPATAEGDLIHWHGGMTALRRALSQFDRGPLDRAIQDIPEILHGAHRLCSLEHHDRSYVDPAPEGSRPIAELLLADPARLSLAFAMLYALPATPAVYAGSELGLAPGARASTRRLEEARLSDNPAVATLTRLNRLRHRRPALAHGDLFAIRPDTNDCIFWLRSTDDSHLVLVANLSATAKTVHVPVERLDRTGLRAGVQLRALRREAEPILPPFSIRLPPFGFRWFELEAV